MQDIFLNLGLFFAGVLVSYLFFRLEAREGRESDKMMSRKLTKEGEAMRVRVDLLEQRLQNVLSTVKLSPAEKQKLDGIFDEIQFIEIIEAIDPTGDLKNGDDNKVKELTKKLLFFIIREIYHFPFTQYHAFILWLRLRDYDIPNYLVFHDQRLYEQALSKVEKLNRVGIGPEEVDVKLLFSPKRPFQI
jgi:hypothetical protein